MKHYAIYETRRDFLFLSLVPCFIAAHILSSVPSLITRSPMRKNKTLLFIAANVVAQTKRILIQSSGKHLNPKIKRTRALPLQCTLNLLNLFYDLQSRIADNLKCNMFSGSAIAMTLQQRLAAVKLYRPLWNQLTLARRENSETVTDREKQLWPVDSSFSQYKAFVQRTLKKIVGIC